VTWGIIGQDAAIETLRRAVEDAAKLSHAYLFVGPEQVGKATAARRFAQALNCTRGIGKWEMGNGADEEEPDSRFPIPDSPSIPCLQCRACRLIEEGKHPDVEYVSVGGVCEESEHKDHSADNSKDIRICQVRRLERVISRAPFEAPWRVVTVDPADALTVEAANAFLKTLEEPPAQVVLVLVTSREEALPETVRSRLRRVPFAGVPREAIAAALVEHWGAEPAPAEKLARLAQGRLGWAVTALQDESLLEGREAALEDVERLAAAGYAERFKLAGSLAARYPRDPIAVRSTLETWAGWWRDVLLVASGREELVAEIERLDTLRTQAAKWGVRGAVQAIEAVREAGRHLDENVNPTLALEVMLLDWPSPGARAAA
jgi:DNA polymerase-3 subunit delta'